MKQPFYGWVVVAAAFTLMFTGFGAAYSFAAFFTAFQQEFGASRAHVALVFSICAFIWFGLGAPGGMLADRYGPRWVALVGVACMVAGLVMAAFARSVEALYLTYSIGIGVGVGLTYVPSVGAVQPWFMRNRAFASGIAVAGIGAGNLVVPPLAAWWIELFGWRGAYLMLAGFVALLAGAAAAAIENDPARRGLAPDGARLAPAGAAATSAHGDLRQRPRADRATVPGMTLREAFRTRGFWLLYGSLLFASVGLFVPMVHLGPYALDAGLSEAQGIALISLIGLGSLIGRFAIGGIADRAGHRPTLAMLYAGLGAMLLLWWSAQAFWLLALFAFSFGAFYGGCVALLPTICMDQFGARNVSGIIGTLYTGAGLGTLCGPTFAGAAYDASGAYDLPILASAALCLAGAALVLALRRASPASPA